MEENVATAQVFESRRELCVRPGVIPVRCASLHAPSPGYTGAARKHVAANRFSSRSRPVLPAEIPGGFSSSLLPPSFPWGRSATFFFEVRPARCRPFSRRAAAFVVGAQ